LSRVVLAIDTSGSFCSLALRDAGDVLHVLSSSGEGDHFERLPELTHSILSSADVKVSDVISILIGVGPGSFTGIRIGMSFAKGLAWSSRAALLGVSSFFGCAAAAAKRFPEATQVVVVSDARRQELFFGLYDVIATGVVCREEPRIVAEAHVSELMAKGVVSGLVVVTPQRDLSVPGVEISPVSSTALGFLGVAAAGAAFSVASLAAIEPSYVRAVAAKTIAERALKT
jgi:tRNA threonylcarbamoyl adenosine modification protein YeaZ